MQESTDPKQRLISAKRELRQQMLSRRLDLDPAIGAQAATEVSRRLCSYRQLADASFVFVTLPHKNELDLRQFISSALQRGQRLAMPRCSPEGLELVELISLRGEWRSDQYGIPAPHNTQLVAESLLDCLLFPGLAFDQQGNRLGYGAGLLDGLARRSVNARLIGACYSWQIIPEVPVSGSDVPVNTIITELASFEAI